VYQAGTSGGPWSEEEVASTRQRVLQMIHPDWDVKEEMYQLDKTDSTKGEISENVLLRLVFHDCMRYTDGSGGCDGCLNWHGVGNQMPNPNDGDDMYNFEPFDETDNNGLDQIAEKLELIYTTIDWPFQTPSLEVSLRQSGKSRADLWELAANVALERTLERANRACDLDFHARQQVTLLESRDACEIKLTKPLKFQTGRKDCVSDDPEGRGYVTTQPEVQPSMFGDADHVVDYGKEQFGIDALHWTALQGIHAVVHRANVGTKYTWFGPGYLSNMFFKMLANKPTYRFENGGDLSFGKGMNLWHTAVGDEDGNPVAQTGWRASCMYAWNTTEGGPCFMRPTPATAADAPNPDKMASNKCVTKVENGKCVMNTKERLCKNAYCDENLVVHGALPEGASRAVSGPWVDNQSPFDIATRHNQGWSNQFAFPWEIGMYYSFQVGGVSKRAIGCPGLDEPMGTVDEPLWPFRTKCCPIVASPAMDCDVNTYAPEGQPMYSIVDELAADNEFFAATFLDGWQQMTSNGYTADELVDGPQNSWIGHYSLAQQGVDVGDFESFINENAPVTFTDATVDPYICGHLGHFLVSCQNRFSTCFDNGYCPSNN